VMIMESLRVRQFVHHSARARLWWRGASTTSNRSSPV
jgi:hypothetical protein